MAASESKHDSDLMDELGAKEPETNADGTPRVPNRPHCAGATRMGHPCMRVVLSHEVDGKLYCNSHAPAGAVLVKWDPTRIPLCEGLLADGHSRCTRSVLEHVSVGPGVERGLCRKHLDHWATHQTLILSKNSRKKRRMPAFVIGEDVVEEETPVVEHEPVAPRDRPSDLRQALQTTAEEAYAEIEFGLREAIRSASKLTRCTCPSCKHVFSLQVRDWSAVIRASSELLDRVVSKPQVASAAATVDPNVPLTAEEIERLSTEELLRLIVHTRVVAAPTEMTPETRFGDFYREIQETRDTLASWDEGHDVEPVRLALAHTRVRYWGELAQLLAPFVGMTFDPELTR
jgi:hypothetical protein